VAPKGRHTRSNPQLPLATPEFDLEKIIRNKRTPREGTSTTLPDISGNFHNPSLETQVSPSHSHVIPYVGVSRSLRFGSVPVDFSPPSLGLEGETFDTHVSPEVVLCFKPKTLEYFPTPKFTTPPPIRVFPFTEGETFVPSSPIAFYPNSQFPFLPETQFQSPLFKLHPLLVLLQFTSQW